MTKLNWETHKAAGPYSFFVWHSPSGYYTINMALVAEDDSTYEVSLTHSGDRLFWHDKAKVDETIKKLVYKSEKQLNDLWVRINAEDDSEDDIAY